MAPSSCGTGRSAGSVTQPRVTHAKRPRYESKDGVFERRKTHLRPLGSQPRPRSGWCGPPSLEPQRARARAQCHHACHAHHSSTRGQLRRATTRASRATRGAGCILNAQACARREKAARASRLDLGDFSRTQGRFECESAAAVMSCYTRVYGRRNYYTPV